MKHLVAVGAHAGDMEITAGAVVAGHVRRGGKATFLHLSLGDKGHPKLAPAEYALQKRAEAERAAAAVGAEAFFLPYRDAEIFCNEATILEVADALRALKADVVITHWGESIHPDHTACHRIVTEALFYTAVPHLKRPHPNHPARGPYYAENWEDRFGFEPYVYVDVSEDYDAWEACVREYALFRGEVVNWPYLDYYRSLLRLRGCLAGCRYAQAFAVPEKEKRVTRASLVL
ncbi:MAG: PIG-L family deacetylase [Armatimonadota bacterium]|jgi:LmbE family N-acetylglucosaminyl deacetylase|nr:PIG-L family deacetylase [Armatimonadota bacterium]